MPQSFAQWLSGYVDLTVDTLGQKIFNHSPPPDHPLFPPPSSSCSSCSCSLSSAAAGRTLRGHVSVITGANTGIGYETARHLASLGATVILACRNPHKAAVAAEAIRASHPGALVETGVLDLSSYISVRAFADSLSGRRVHSLVLNGGIMGVPHSDPEMHFAVNHVAHALLALLLLPMLAKAAERDDEEGERGAGDGLWRSRYGRVVFVSSLTARVSDLCLDDIAFAKRPYRWMTAYANSKLAMVLFCRALAARIGRGPVVANAVHPGEAPSDVARHLGRVAEFGHKHIVGPLCLLSTPEAARTSVYAAAAQEVDSSGEFYYRTCRKLELPDHLVRDEDAEAVWELTLQMAGVTEKDLCGLRTLENKAAVPKQDVVDTT